MYKTKSSSRNINMKSQINIIATMTTLDFISVDLHDGNVDFSTWAI